MAQMLLPIQIEHTPIDMFEQLYGYKDVGEYLNRFPCVFDRI